MKSPFKAATAYRMVEPIDNISALNDFRVHECAPGQEECCGWENPQDKNCVENHHVINTGKGEWYTILSLVTVSRKPKPAAINRAVAKRVAEVEKLSDVPNYKLQRKVINDIRADIIAAALPHILPEESRTYAYIDWSNNLLIVCESSVNKCEKFLKELRHCLGTLSVDPLFPKNLPENVMKAWIKNNAYPPKTSLVGGGAFKNPVNISQGASVKDVEMNGSGINGFIDDGMVPHKLALEWNMTDTAEVLFTVSDTVVLSNISFGDEVFSDDGDYEDAELEYNAQMLVTCSTVTAALLLCFDLFGGIGE